MSAPTRVAAAGGIVVDRDGRVAVVRRPHRGDWSLPKGKVEAGESDRAAAVREVAEETGLEADVVGLGPTARYLDHRGRPKRVRYFVMTRPRGRFVPNDEVDRLEWLALDEAADRLTYPADRAVLAAWRAASAQEATGAGRGG